MSEKCHLIDLRGGIGARIVRTALGCLFLPAYRLAFNIRRARYLSERSRLPGLPVISVGNLALGGAGKTPLALVLWQALLRRGYHGGVVLKLGGSEQSYFDEFTLYLNSLCRSSSKNPVVQRQEGRILARTEAGFVLAHRNKLTALRWLAGTGEYQFALLDDGFQLYSLEPALSLCIVRASDWREHVFPLGELREETAALRRADIALLREAVGVKTVAEELPESTRAYPRLRLRPLGLLPASELTHPWIRDREPMTSQPGPEASLPTGAALAFSGIAHPDEFEQFVFALHADTRVCVRFGDHHRLNTADLRMLHRLRKAHGCRCFLTTEKDACRLLPHLLSALRARGHEVSWPEELLPTPQHFTPDFTVELEELWESLYFLKLAAEIPPVVAHRAFDAVSEGLRKAL